MNKVAEYAKAVAALLVSAFGLYQAAKGIDTPAGAGVTSDEWQNIVFTSLLTGFAVWGVPNAVKMLPGNTVTSTFTATSAPEPAPQHAFDDGVAGH